MKKKRDQAEEMAAAADMAGGAMGGGFVGGVIQVGEDSSPRKHNGMRPPKRPRNLWARSKWRRS